GIIGAVKGNMEIAKADRSAPTLDEIDSYLGLLIGLPPGHLFRNAIPIQDLTTYITPGGADELQASPEAVAGAVHSFLHPVVPTVQHHNNGGSGKGKNSLPRKDVSVLVLNAGTITGEASDTRYKLKKLGFATRKLTANA